MYHLYQLKNVLFTNIDKSYWSTNIDNPIGQYWNIYVVIYKKNASKTGKEKFISLNEWYYLIEIKYQSNKTTQYRRHVLYPSRKLKAKEQTKQTKLCLGAPWKWYLLIRYSIEEITKMG